jgi:quercetin dioxygenase-like cupin family protein
MSDQSRFFDVLADIRPYPVWPGLLARAFRGERMTVAVVDLEANAEAAHHSHDNEQLGIVLRGTIDFTIGDEQRLLGPGETYVIPPGVPHRAVGGPAGCTVIDVFAPPRDDWEKLERLEPSKPAWP